MNKEFSIFGNIVINNRIIGFLFYYPKTLIKYWYLTNFLMVKKVINTLLVTKKMKKIFDCK